jgi:hypothetical protein
LPRGSQQRPKTNRQGYPRKQHCIGRTGTMVKVSYHGGPRYWIREPLMPEDQLITWCTHDDGGGAGRIEFCLFPEVSELPRKQLAGLAAFVLAGGGRRKHNHHLEAGAARPARINRRTRPARPSPAPGPNARDAGRPVITVPLSHPWRKERRRPRHARGRPMNGYQIDRRRAAVLTNTNQACTWLCPAFLPV